QEGVAEPAGDILVSCGGTLIGAQTGIQTLSLYVNANFVAPLGVNVNQNLITSRQLFTGPNVPNSIPTEAALLINDCTSIGGLSSAGTSCAASGTFLGGNPVQGFLQNGALTFTGFT